MRSKSFEMQEVRKIGRKDAGESIDFLSYVFQVEGKECKDQERLKICRRKSMPERGGCFSMR